MSWQLKALLGGIVAAMVALSVYAYQNGVTGDPTAENGSPAFVDRMIPAPNTEALSQDEVGIELAEGFDAYLILGGVSVRQNATESQPDGLRRNTAVRGVYYDPGPGRTIEALTTPRACVTAMVYRSTEGPDTAEPFQWCFDTT